MTRKAVVWAAVGAGVAALAVTLFWSLGFRLFAIQTPSMGQTAPVGTLVVTHSTATYGVGDIISFERGPRTYTHRIIAVGTDGSFTTKGDLNGAADPLPVTVQDVIGRAVLVAPGLGWVLQGLPWFALGLLVVFLLSLIGHLDHAWKWVIRLSGASIAFCLVVLWLRPWVNLDMLGYVPADDVGVLMHVVNTGLFPVAADGTVLASGQDAVIHVTTQNAQGYFTLTPTPALQWWQHVLIYLVCLVPLAAALLIRAEPDAAAVSTITTSPDRSVTGRRGRAILIAAIVAAVAISVAVVNQTSSLAALSGSIRNSTNTAASRTFFNCTNAVSSLGKSSTLVAYAMGTSGTTTETDLSGNSYTGTYAATTSTYTTTVGCNHDTPKAAVTFNGSSQCLYLPSGSSQTNPSTFSLEAWFRTTSKSNGVIIGFNSNRTGVGDSNHDRKIYLDKDGRVVFGVYSNNAVKIIYTAAGTNYADGNWHHVVATFSASTGMRLYLDGSSADSDSSVTSAQNFTGYWKIGCGNLSSWRNAATDQSGSTSNDYSGPSYFTGQIQFATVYNVVLNATASTQVNEHYQAGLP